MRRPTARSRSTRRRTAAEVDAAEPAPATAKAVTAKAATATAATAKAAGVFEALGEPVRRRILELLAVGEQPVGPLVAALRSLTPISQPAVSQHLKVLKDAGLILDERQGARRIYRIDVRGIQAMHAYLDRFWDQSLAAYKAAVEKESDS